MTTRKREMFDCDCGVWSDAKRLAHKQGVYLNRYLENAIAFYNGTMETAGDGTTKRKGRSDPDRRGVVGKGVA
jgi:hypothetical protein